MTQGNRSESGSRICIVCGSTSTPLHRTVGKFQILRCRGCGLLFVGNLEAVDLNDFYEWDYFNNKRHGFIGYREYSSGVDVDRLNAIRLSKLLKKYDAGGRKLLDVGAAQGVLIKVMGGLGWDAKGIDPSAYAVATGTELYGVDLTQATLEEFEPGEERFDVITLIGVLEHLTSPKKDLEKIHRLLNPGGLLLFTYLNAGRYLRLYKIKPPEHVFYFNHRHVASLLGKTGFQILKTKMHLRTYRFSEFVYRVNTILLPWLIDPCDRLFNRFPRLEVVARFPTNEMLFVARKG